jgi:hypothetical protein
MTETDNTIVLAGRVVGFIPPTQGQMESMVRIGKTILRGTDDDSSEFYMTQIDRVGRLLESLIAEQDRDLVDDLYLTGKIDHATLMSAIIEKVKEKSDSKTESAKPVRAKRK